MRKLILIFMVFFSAASHAQDSLGLSHGHHLSAGEIAIDTASVKLRKLPADFRQQYTDPEFIYELKSPQKNFWDKFLEALSQWLQSLFNIGTSETSMNIALNVVRVIAVVIVIVVIYFIVKAVLNKEGQWIFGKNANKKVINYEDITNNIHATDFEKLIKESVLAGEKRLSIRYHYLWLLKRMSDRNIIIWDPEKTNSDYLYEIENTPHKGNFEYLSYLYNYIWYGEFDIDDQMFERAKNAFENTIRTI
jgi:hypothetical protein